MNAIASQCKIAQWAGTFLFSSLIPPLFFLAWLYTPWEGTPFNFVCAGVIIYTAVAFLVITQIGHVGIQRAAVCWSVAASYFIAMLVLFFCAIGEFAWVIGIPQLLGLGACLVGFLDLSSAYRRQGERPASATSDTAIPPRA